MNFGTMFKAVDTVLALKDAVGRMRGSPGPRDDVPTTPSTTSPNAAQPIEARLTGIVLAALKEAFDRDHSRLELEREQFEQQQRRAEEALQLEVQRQRADRELTRLRLLAGMALLAWVASMIAVVISGLAASPVARVTLGAGWVLLLAAFASAYTAQERVGEWAASNAVAAAPRTSLPLWLLLAGLAVSAVSVLLAP